MNDPLDLSARHELISNLVSIPGSSEEWAQYRLTPEQVAFYHEFGYLAGIRMLNQEQVELLRGELNDLVDPSHSKRSLFYEFHSNESCDPSRVLFHALGAWRIAPDFMICSGILDSRWLLHNSWRSGPLLARPVVLQTGPSRWERGLASGLLLLDPDLADGPSKLLDRAGRLDSREWLCALRSRKSPLGVAAHHRSCGRYEAIQTVLSKEQQSAFKPVAIELKSGESSFHHPLMVHGSYENSTDRPRRATVINVFREVVESASNEPLLEGVPPIRMGDRVSGQFFPLLFDERDLSRG